jgi:hypothetical protein
MSFANYENQQDSYEKHIRCKNITYYLLNIGILLLQIIVIVIAIIAYINKYYKDTIAVNIANALTILLLLIDSFNRSDIFSQISGISDFSNIHFGYCADLFYNVAYNDQIDFTTIDSDKLSFNMSCFILTRALVGLILPIILGEYVNNVDILFKILYVYNFSYIYVWIILIMLRKLRVARHLENIYINQQILTFAGMRLS